MAFYMANRIPDGLKEPNNTGILSLKFKGIILNNLIKSTTKDVSNAFYKWYASSNFTLKSKAIDIFLAKILTKEAFLYRAKRYVRQHKKYQENTPQEIQAAKFKKWENRCSQILQESTSNEFYDNGSKNRKISNCTEPKSKKENKNRRSNVSMIVNSQFQRQPSLLLEQTPSCGGCTSPSPSPHIVPTSQLRYNDSNSIYKTLKHIISSKLLNKDSSKKGVNQNSSGSSSASVSVDGLEKNQKQFKSPSKDLILKIGLMLISNCIKSSQSKNVCIAYSLIKYYAGKDQNYEEHLQFTKRALQLVNEGLQKDREIQQLWQEIQMKRQQIENLQNEASERTIVNPRLPLCILLRNIWRVKIEQVMLILEGKNNNTLLDGIFQAQVQQMKFSKTSILQGDRYDLRVDKVGGFSEDSSQQSHSRIHNVEINYDELCSLKEILQKEQKFEETQLP